jgi:hypothetical protein
MLIITAANLLWLEAASSGTARSVMVLPLQGWQ